MRILISGLFLMVVSISSAQLTFEPKVVIPRSSSEVGVADFDKDGHVDIAIASGNQRWYAGPNFTTWYSIGTSDGGPYAARVSDVNGDGWDDFVTSDGTRNAQDMPGNIYLYLNPTDTGDVFSPWQRIVVYTGQVRHQNDMRVVDIDGDGRLDIIEKTWSSERVVVAFQNADINTWTVRAFDTGETGKPEGISAGDVDGDGANEIVLSGVYWDAQNWRQDTPTEYLIDPIFVQEEVKSEVGDIDNDGDNDIYMGSCEGTYKELAWYENVGIDSTGGVIFNKHTIKPNTGKYHMVQLIDMDFDGDLDLATGKSFGDDGATIFYNENNGATWTESVYDPNGNLYTGIAADLDADGDLDIVGPQGFYQTVAYYINNTPGNPPSPPDSTIATLQTDNSILVTWRDNSLDEGSFLLEVNDNGSWISRAQIPANDTSYLETMTSPGEVYSFRIRAVNAAGASSWDTSNMVMTLPQAESVIANPPGGNYVNPPTIQLSTPSGSFSIHYTTDGTDPTMMDSLYLMPFTLSQSTTLKARAFSNTSIPSLIQSESYNIAVNGNFPPVADAGQDQLITAIQQISLDGSSSFDLDDPIDSLTFSWAQIAGPSITIVSPTDIIASFTPTNTGNYQFVLSVEDEQAVDLDTVMVTVNLLDQDLVAYWPMDDLQGSSIQELVNQNNGNINNGVTLSPIEGKVDGALLFDGTSGRVDCPSININGSEMTITFWMKMTGTANPEGRMISKASSTSGSDHNYMVSQISTTALRFRLKTTTGGTATLASSTGQIPIDQWIFVVARYDGSQMELYNNTSLIASVNKTGTIVPGSSGLGIGNQPSGSGDRPFEGYLDDVRIYDTALSLQDIQTIYNNSCSNYLLISNQIIDENLSLYSKQTIELQNVTVLPSNSLTLNTQKVIIDANSVIDEANLTIVKSSGCN